ncbi:MAG: hypothetical protein AB1345_12605 [Chloroflexota bacterium]
MRRSLPFFLFALGAAMLAFSLLYTIYHVAISDPSPTPLPQHLAGLPLTQQLTGRRASTNITNLHSKAFPITSAAVGQYGHNQQVTLWVTGTPLKPITTLLTKAMRTKIAEGNSPFTNLGEKYVEEFIIYQLKGAGQLHFYYQAGVYLIWLAADAEFAEQALAETIAFYR